METEIKRGGVKKPIIGTDHFVGSTSTIPYEAVCDDFTPFLPDTDSQVGKEDWVRCVSESYVHVVSTYLNWALKNNKFSQKQIDEMTDLGYIVNGRFDISIRAVAKMSGTDRTGNAQNIVAECVRKQGLIPNRDWPSDASMDWNTHYATIPQNLLVKARLILNYADFRYAWISSDANSVADYKTVNQTIALHVKQSPVQFTSPICPSYHNRYNTIIASCDLIDTDHAMAIYGIQNVGGALDRKVRDSYPPYNIVFANNYPMPYILKIFPIIILDTTLPVDPNVIPNATPAQVEVIKENFFTQIINILKALFKIESK